MKAKMFKLPEAIVKEVVDALKGYIETIDEDCAYRGCMCDLRGEPCSHKVSVTLHNFEEGYHLV